MRLEIGDIIGNDPKRGSCPNCRGEVISDSEYKFIGCSNHGYPPKVICISDLVGTPRPIPPLDRIIVVEDSFTSWVKEVREEADVNQTS